MNEQPEAASRSISVEMAAKAIISEELSSTPSNRRWKRLEIMSSTFHTWDFGQDDCVYPPAGRPKYSWHISP